MMKIHFGFSPLLASGLSAIISFKEELLVNCINLLHSGHLLHLLRKLKGILKWFHGNCQTTKVHS